MALGAFGEWRSLSQVQILSSLPYERPGFPGLLLLAGLSPQAALTRLTPTLTPTQVIYRVTGLANLSGTDRYVTNANVANWAQAHAGLTFTHTGIAAGDKFPDALASGPYLAKDHGTLLLSPLFGPLPPVIGAIITSNQAAVQHVTFIACIEPVIGQVKALLP